MNELDNPASRLAKLRGMLELSQNAFAKQVDITQGALSQLESGKSALSLPTIQKICDAFDVDCNWLVMGSEQSTIFSHSNSNTMHKNNMEADSHSFSRDILIPLIYEGAHAGYIKDCENSDYISSLDVYRIPGFEQGDFRMFEVVGDSMVPTIYPREIVITERVAQKASIDDGHLCVAITEEGIVAKRVYVHEKHHFIFKSDNPKFKSYSLPMKEVKEIWSIRAKITSELTAGVNLDTERFESIESELKSLRNEISQLTKG
jgi:transcriptional regulator with XRE-family HTH domain